MRARAALVTEHDDGRTRVSTLRSEAPLTLRLTMPVHPEPWAARTSGAARVCLAAGAAGPIGGDELALDVDVGAASALVLRDIAATLLLPGPDGAQSRTRIRIRVGAGATLVWWPEPIIAAERCHHRTDVDIDLHPDARLLLREELLLGRHHERPGTVHHHLRVRRGGRPLLHQHLHLGPDAAGWDGPAVTGGLRALGSVLLVDPAEDAPAPAVPGETTALMALPGPAVLLSALAADSVTLRRRLDAGLPTLDQGPVPGPDTDERNRPDRPAGRECTPAGLSAGPLPAGPRQS